MKKYEAVFILDIRKTDDEGAAFTKEFAELITSLGGKMESATPMGRRQFTYEINKRKAGIYFDFIFELETAKVIDIKEKYKLDDRILRNMILICDRPETAAEGPIKLTLAYERIRSAGSLILEVLTLEAENGITEQGFSVG